RPPILPLRTVRRRLRNAARCGARLGLRLFRRAALLDAILQVHLTVVVARRARLRPFGEALHAVERLDQLFGELQLTGELARDAAEQVVGVLQLADDRVVLI